MKNKILFCTALLLLLAFSVKTRLSLPVTTISEYPFSFSDNLSNNLEPNQIPDFTNSDHQKPYFHNNHSLIASPPSIRESGKYIAVQQAGILPLEILAFLQPNFGYLLAAIFFFLTIGLSIYFRRQKKLLKKNQQLLSTEKQLIESELKEAAAQLYAFTDSIWKKNNVIDAYTAELEKRDSLSESYFKLEHEETMQQLLQATLLTDEQWDSFRQLFDKVHPGFMLRLQETVPGLSPAETRYFVLTKLNLSNKEMAAMLGIGQDSIRQYRSRLRRKLNIVTEDGLHELVLSI